MRTAIITAVTHDGKGVLVSGKEIGLIKQLEIFKGFRKAAHEAGSHEQYAEVSFQENDNGEEIIRFRTPADQKKHLAARAQEKKEHAESIAAQEQADKEPAKPEKSKTKNEVTKE